MFNFEARHLLLSLNSRANLQSPIGPQLSFLFTVSIGFKNVHVIPADTVRGRISCFFNRKKNQEVLSRQIHQTFAHAIQCLHASPQDFRDIPIPLQSALTRHLAEKKLLAAEVELNSEFPDIKELNALGLACDEAGKTQKEKDAKELEQVMKLSFLHFGTPKELSAEESQQLFRLSTIRTYSQEFEECFVRFLKQHPEYSAKDLDERLDLVQKGRVFSKSVMKHCFPDGQTLSGKERSEKYQQIAEHMAKWVTTLQVGSEWMFCGGYGKPFTQSSLQGLSDHIPPEIYQGIPTQLQSRIKSVFTQGKLPDPGAFVSDLIRSGIQQISQHVPSGALPASIHQMLIDMLLPNQSRELTDRLAALMPCSVKSGIESWLKQGLIGNVMEFIEDGDGRDFVLWAIGKAEEYHKSPETFPKQFASEVEQKVTKYTQPFTEAISSVHESIQECVRKIPKVIPATLGHLFGLNSLFESGEFWIRFTPIGGNQFNIFIYANGSAVCTKQHSPNADTSEVIWPIQLTNVPGELLNPDFFMRLLHHYIEPKCDSEFTSRAEDLYSNVIGYLKGHIEAPHNPPLKRVDHTDLSPNYLFQLFATSAQIPPEIAVFDMRCEAMAAFCQPFLKGDNRILTIETISDCQKIEKILEMLKGEFETLKPLLPERKVHSVSAAIREIQIAIKAFKKGNDKKTRFALPQTLINAIRESSTSSDAIKMIHSHKEVLAWAFGDDLKDLIEVIASAVNSPEHATPVSNSSVSSSSATPPRRRTHAGWLRTILFNGYFRLVMNALNVMYMMVRVYTIGVGYLIRPAPARWLFPKIIPTAIKEWFATVIGELSRRFANIVILFILRYLFSPAKAEQLKFLFRTYRREIGLWAKALSGKGIVSYELNSPLTEPETKPFLSFSAFEDESQKLNPEGGILQPVIPTFFYRATPELIRKGFAEFPEKLLEGFIHESRKCSSKEQSLHYILSQLTFLELPNAGSKCVWDEVSHPEACLEILSNISVELSQCASSCSCSPSAFGELLIGVYTILAVMDRLARRCPGTQLEGFKINAYPLLQQIKNGSRAQLEDPILVERLKAICRYFTPEINLDEIPTGKQLEKYAKGCLFDYSFLQNVIVDMGSSKEFILMKKFLTPDAIRRIDGILKIPEFSHGENYLILFLISYSNCFCNPGPPLLPKALCLLRFQTLLCTHICNSLTIEGTGRINVGHGWPADMLKRSKTDIYAHEQRSILQVLSDPASLLQKVDLMAEKTRTMFSEMSPVRFLDRDFPKDPALLRAYNGSFTDDSETPKTQSDLVTTEMCCSVDAAYQLSQCEPSDRIIRLIEFLEAHPDSHYTTFQELNRHLFLNQTLAQQLTSSPHVATAIGEVIKKTLERSFLKKNDHGYLRFLQLAIKLKRFCQFYAPGYVSSFPNFREEIRKVRPDMFSDSSLLLLATETIDQDPSVEREDRYECVLALCTAFFWIKSKNIETNSYVSIPKFIVKYKQWLPAIVDILKDFSRRKKLIQEICIGIEKPLSAGEGNIWENFVVGYPGLIFESGSIVINFSTGILIQANSRTGITNRFHDVIKKYCPPETLRALPGTSSLVSENGEFQFTHCTVHKASDLPFPVWDSSEHLRVRRLFNGKRFRKLPEEINFCPLFEQLSKQIDKRKADFWIEVTTDPVKELLCFEGGTLQAHFKVTDKGLSTYDFLATLPEQLQLIPSSAFSSGMLPLLQFCSLSDLQCWTTPSERFIKRIHIPQYALTFNVQNTAEGLCASSVEFPGYAIERTQSHPLTSHFSSSLLLINSNKERRVLIPKGNWIFDTFWNHFSFLGPFAHLIKHLVNDSAQRTHTKYYTYDIDEDTGILKSEDPEALGYLITVYLLKGDYKSAEAACTAFELLCKGKHIPQEVLYAMLPIFIPDSIKNVRFIRQRILSVLEGSHLIHGPYGEHFAKKNKEENVSKMEIGLHVVTVFTIFYDLAYPTKNPQQRLSDSQEWFLFKRLIRSLRILYDSKMYIPSENSFNLIKKLGFENLIECIAFQGAIGLRYRHLKKKFGETESLTLRATRFVTRAFCEPSTIPSLSATSLLPSLTSNSSAALPIALRELGKEWYFSKDNLKANELSQAVLVNVQDSVSFSLSVVTKGNYFVRHFFTFYAIALGEKGGDQKKALVQFLYLMKGGCNPRTSVLVEYLEMVCLAPIFWSTSQVRKNVITRFRKDFPGPESPYFHINELNDFFDHLHSRFSTCDAISHGVEVGSSIAMRTVLPNFMIGQLSELTAGGLFFPGAHLISKVAGAYTKLSMSIASDRTTVPALDVSFASIEGSTRFIDQNLEKVFSMLFTEYRFKERKEKEEKAQGEAIFPLTSRGTALQKSCIDQVIQSAQDYALRPDREVVCLRPKSLQQFWMAYGHFCHFKEKMQKLFEKERALILKYVDLFKYPDPELEECEIDIRMLHFCFMNNDYRRLLEVRNIPKSQIPHLHIAIGKDLLNVIRFDQLERINNHFKNLNPSHEEYEQTLDQIATELKATMAFDFTDLDQKLLRFYMLFQAYTHTMLWKKQAHSLIRMLVVEKGDALLELLMSFGKTFFGVPTIDAYTADGSVIVFNAWVPGMFGTNTRQITTQSKHVYNQTANALIFRRNIPLKIENLSALIVLLKTALEQGETINLEKESAQALELIFIEKLFNASNKKNPLLPEEELEITLLSDLLLMMLSSGVLVGDEVHELLSSLQELNHPIGAKLTLLKNYCEIVEACFRYIVGLPAVRKLIKEGNKAKFLLTIYQEIIVPELADHMSYYWKFAIREDQRKVFTDFVTGKAKEISPYLSTHKHYSEICLVKGLITVIFPLVFSQDPNVMFGFSKGKRGKIAIPYDANASSMEQASLKSPFVFLVKLMYLFFNLENGLDKEESTNVLELLKNKMEREADKRKMRPTETRASKLCSRMVQGPYALDECSSWPKENLEKALKEIGNSDEGILFYIRNFLWKETTFWEFNICSNSQNSASMFGKLLFDTGTPYNPGAYPDKVKLLLDPGTAGEVLHILSKKCPPDGIHILRQSSPREVLDEILPRFFQMGSKFRAIIDGGPLFQGLENLTVVRQMVAFAKRHRPDILAIDFFMRDEKLVDQVMSIVVESGEVIPHDRCRVALAARLCYFDQKHGFAANIRIKYDGAGLHLIGRNHKFYRLSQESFRLRQLKTFKRIINEEMEQAEWEKLNLFRTATIHFAMTPEIQREISTRPIPSLQEIVEYSIKNEAQEATNNQIDYCKKLADISRREVLNKILLERNVSTKLSIFKKGQDHLIARNVVDPVALFGFIEEPVSTEIALRSVRKRELDLAIQTGLFTREEMTAIAGKIEGTKVHPMPETTIVRKDKRGNIEISKNDFDAIQNVDINENANEDVNRDNELNLNLDMQRDTNLTPKKFRFTEWGWTKKLNPRSLDWLTFESAAGTSSLASIVASGISDIGKRLSGTRETYGIPPLFKISDLLFQSSHPALRKIAGLFHSRIWATNNFIPTILSSPLEEQVLIASREQRHLKELLIHFEEIGKEIRILSAGCLSFRDAAIWRKMITAPGIDSKEVEEKREVERKEKEGKIEVEQKEKEEKRGKEAGSSKIKVIVYDLSLRIPVAGDVNAVPLTTLRKSRDLLIIETGLKILNGDVAYHPDQVKILEELAKLDGVVPAFHAIHLQRGKAPIAGTDIDYVISDAEGIPIEEQF